MKMVTISETRHSTVDTDQEHGSDAGHSSDSSPRLLPCHLIQLSPESAGNNSFHQITRHRSRRGSLQSEAFSEPVFQRQGKLVTFFRGFVLPRTLIGKSRRKKVFGADLADHLFTAGIHVPQVVTVCCNFIEARGLVDGVYRLSGISSNIQRLKKSFDDDKVPDLFKDRLVLQDIHSVSSLVKLYFRELPSPVGTFHLYDEFVNSVRASEEVRIMKLREVISQLPDPNYNTLEFLLKHLHRISLRHKETGMTSKNLAIVWAPNLLRSEALEAGGLDALQGVAVQAVVTEYLIKYCHLIFTSPSQNNTPRTTNRVSSVQHQFPISSPIKLLSLAEAQEQYQKMTHKRNHILPIHSLTLNTRKKAKYWSKKTFFSKKREEILEENPLCPCFSSSRSDKNSAQASCCRCLSRFDPDSSSDMETTFLTRRPGDDSDQEQSPVILRCLRRGTSADSDNSSGVQKRSSLRDKFRKFALTPISSSHNLMEKLDEAARCSGLAGQHVNQRILHLNESLEFIDASSDDESESEMSPNIKRSKIVTRLMPSNENQQKSQTAAVSVSNHVIKESSESKTEKCETNQQKSEMIIEQEKTTKLSEKKNDMTADEAEIVRDKVTSTHQIESCQINSQSLSKNTTKQVNCKINSSESNLVDPGIREEKIKCCVEVVPGLSEL